MRNIFLRNLGHVKIEIGNHGMDGFVLQRNIRLEGRKTLGAGDFEKILQQYQAEAFGLIFFIHQQEKFGGILAGEFEVAGDGRHFPAVVHYFRRHGKGSRIIYFAEIAQALQRGGFFGMAET